MQQPPDSPPPADPFTLSDPSAVLTAAEELSDGISATLRMTRALVDSRRAVDLTGFDRMVGLLCARALDLPPEQGRVLRTRLAALLEDVENLSAVLVPP